MNGIDFPAEQNIILTQRERMELSGIADVESFSEVSVIAKSHLGDVSIEGEELRIESFSSESGRLVVCGRIDGFFYFGVEKRKRGLFRTSKV